ncbi:hypothetical protein AB0L56_01120 [Streptomyces sp. NPDC052079]|uniref:hypothetical protein n=1 Tax=Streptomyces sp. NPDC052079 TaxID=3155526 RepID=UPI0034133A5F
MRRILGEQALTQHRFDWLLSDPGGRGPPDPAAGRRVLARPPAVVEYREIRHDQPVPHFDKPDRLTVSGVHGGEQRALYDARRKTEIPTHGLG